MEDSPSHEGIRGHAAALGQGNGAGGIKGKEEHRRVGDQGTDVVSALRQRGIRGGKSPINEGHAERQAKNQYRNEGERASSQLVGVHHVLGGHRHGHGIEAGGGHPRVMHSGDGQAHLERQTRNYWMDQAVLSLP